MLLVARELALEFNDCLLPNVDDAHAEADAEYKSMDTEEEGQDVKSVADSVEADDVINENDLIETKSIIVKADGAGSLASIQDTVDDMSGISVWCR